MGQFSGSEGYRVGRHTGSILIHGDIFTTKQNILSQWRKKFRIYKMFRTTGERAGGGGQHKNRGSHRYKDL